MSDLDPSTAGAGRLRRRSFYESIETADGASPRSSSASAMDTIALHDAADASSASASSTIAFDASSSSSSSAPLLSATDESSSSSSSSPPNNARGLRALARSLLQLLAAALWYAQAWCIVKWQSLEVRARLARTLRRGGGPHGGGADGATTEALVVKQYAYPTHWIKLACATLVVCQWAIYAHWQHAPLALHVEECVFSERMLPPGPARERILGGGGGGGGGGPGGGGGRVDRGGGGGAGVGGAPLGGAALGGGAAAMAPPAGATAANAAAMRHLERRFELLQAPALRAQHNSNPRLPWTCIALVPTLKTAAVSVEGADGGPTPTKDVEEPSVSSVVRAAARDLSLLLPRSQIVAPAETAGIAARVHLALASGSAPVVPAVAAAATGDGADAAQAPRGVLAALFPLASFRASLFPRGFPDLVLVKSEYALKKLVLYRHERQEEFQHRLDHHDDGAGGVSGGGGGNALGGSPGEAVQDEARKEEDERLRQAKSKTEFGVYLLKTTVPDIYNRHVRKNWDAFLHVVVVSEQDKKEQLTKEILVLWLHHPEWPTLHVRFQQSLPLCQSFRRFLSTMRQVTGDDAEIVDHDARHGDQTLPPNIDLSCEPAHNTRAEIVRLKNAVGLHLFPVPPEMEVYEDLVLESAAAGALVVTYNTPIMHEWITDACGVRVGSYENAFPAGPSGEPGEVGLLELPQVRVTSGEIERAVEALLTLDRVHRVAAGRAARVRYLAIRTHFLSAVAALDSAICDADSDDAGEMPHEIGTRSRKKVAVDTLRVFLY